MQTTQTLNIPYKTVSWNKLYAANQWRRKDMVNEEREAIAWHLKGKIKPITKKVNIEIHQYSKRPIDSDNVCAKLWIDAMKDIGVLIDDTPEYVGWVSIKSEKGKEDLTIMKISIDTEGERG